LDGTDPADVDQSRVQEEAMRISMLDSFSAVARKIILTPFFLALVGAGPGGQPATDARARVARVRPDFGLMLNDDGDFSFTSMDPAESVRNLQASVDALAGTPVRTLMYSVGAGSDVLYYPTKVASVWGWKDFEEGRKPEWSARIAMARRGMEAGVDPIRVAGKRARRLGLYFVPSYRMNDDHFAFAAEPAEYPLTGEFWIRHQKEYTIGESPILSDARYGLLLDYSHEAVRQYRLGVIFEVIDRYREVMDGIELDFNRVQVLFPRGKAREQAHLVTDLVGRVRGRLDAVGRVAGRDFALFVRVPPTLENCEWAGLDIETWMDRRLVDVLIPSQLMTLAHDMPVDAFVTLANPVGCRVCPSLYPRTAWTWPFAAQPNAERYADPPSRAVAPELVRGAAANYWHMGAAGFQLFNFHHEDAGCRPFSNRVYRILRDLARPETLHSATRIYAVTPAYYLDHEDTYQYRKQLPASLTPGQPHEVTLYVGDDLSNRDVHPAPAYCGLRLGLCGGTAEREVTVTLNERVLHTGALGSALVPVPDQRRSAGAHPPFPTGYLQLAIREMDVVRQGPNRLGVLIKAIEGGDQVTLVEVQLGVVHERNYLEWLTGAG
jgi:hypothetical protein